MGCFFLGVAAAVVSVVGISLLVGTTMLERLEGQLRRPIEESSAT